MKNCFKDWSQSSQLGEESHKPTGVTGVLLRNICFNSDQNVRYSYWYVAKEHIHVHHLFSQKKDVFCQLGCRISYYFVIIWTKCKEQIN